MSSSRPPVGSPSADATAPATPTTRTVLIAAFVAATVVSLTLSMSMPHVLLEAPLNWFVMAGGGVLAFSFVVASGHAVQVRSEPDVPPSPRSEENGRK